MTAAAIGSTIQFAPIGRETPVIGIVREVVIEPERVVGYKVKVDEGFNYFVLAEDVCEVEQ